MSRPDTLPEWATDSSFTAPGEDWDGQPTKVEPSAGKKATGQVPETAFPSPEYNWLLGNLSDWVTYFDQRRSRLILRDHFTGDDLDLGIWFNLVGTPTPIDDDANGGFGAQSLDGTTNVGAGQAIRSCAMALGTLDFCFRARLRTTGIDASSQVSVGINDGGNSTTLMFRIDGAASTTNWGVQIDGAGFAAANGTDASISTSYQEFEIRRVGTTVTFYVDGVLHHTESGYSTSLTGNTCTVRLRALATGVALIDFVELEAYY